MPFILSCYGWLRSGRITNGNVENIGQFFSQDLQPQIFRRLEFFLNCLLMYQGMKGEPGQGAGLGPPGPKVTCQSFRIRS